MDRYDQRLSWFENLIAEKERQEAIWRELLYGPEEPPPLRPLPDYSINPDGA